MRVFVSDTKDRCNLQLMSTGRLSAVTDLVGWATHADAVALAKASYDAIPVGQPVRLAKRTSNLFRARAHTKAAGLDVSGLEGVITVDVATDGDGPATADVQ